MHKETEEEFDNTVGNFNLNDTAIFGNKTYSARGILKQFISTHFIDKRTLKEALEGMEVKLEGNYNSVEKYEADTFNQALQDIKDKLL